MIRQIEEHVRTVTALADAIPLLESIADAILACFARGGRLYIVGNGGSAADAQHISAELLGRFKLDRRALPAIALTTDTSTLTAVCNDLGGDVIFSRQVEGLVTENDIVWLLSVSGRSPNIIAAARAAERRGATRIGFTSRRGQALMDCCDLCLVVDHDESDRVQEAHGLAYHLICERIESKIAPN
jgi:D-sedoheptulose 7-phosphate isomerase